MAGRADRRLRVGVAILLTVALIGLDASPAPATRRTNETEDPEVATADNTVFVSMAIRRNGVLVPVLSGSSTADPRLGPGGCVFSLQRIPESTQSLAEAGAPPSADSRAYWLMCGSAIFDAFWLEPGDIVDLEGLARDEAERYVETVLGPSLSLGVSPPSFVVTGMPGWFWLNGWDGAPIEVPPINPFGDSIEVVLRLDSVVWNFGDGSPPFTGDLGQAYPAESTVQHNYTHRSTSSSDPDGAYEVSAEVTVAVSYRLNGGAETPVNPPLTHTATSPVIVREMQAVLS